MLEVRGDLIAAVNYAPDHALGSVPAGNLWARPLPPPPGAAGETELASALPRPTRLTVRWTLPERPEGYRFQVSAATRDGGGVAQAIGARPTVRELLFAAGTVTYWVEASAPAAVFPPAPQTTVRRSLRAVVARDNRPPRGVIDVVAAPSTSRPHGFDAVVGQTVLLSAERSVDEQRDRIIAFLWDLGGARRARGPRIAHTFASPGPHVVKLTVSDEAGARATVVRELRVALPPSPGCAGCCTPRRVTGAAAAGAGVVALLAVAVLWWRRRRK